MELIGHVTETELPSILVVLGIGFLAGMMMSWLWFKQNSSDKY